MVKTYFKSDRQLREHNRYQGFLMIKDLYNQTIDSIDIEKTTISRLHQLNSGYNTSSKKIKTRCGMVVKNKNYYDRLWNQRYKEICRIVNHVE